MIARKIRELLKLELSIMLLSSLVLMALTYLLVGSKGIEELIAGYNGNFQLLIFYITQSFLLSQ